jgi:hypothetical protein
MLSGRQKHLVGMVHWNAAHRALAVEAYFKNNESMVITRRSATISLFIAVPACH